MRARRDYTVTWRVVSSDGHPIQGTYTFSVGAGKAAAPSQDAGTGESSQAAADTQNSTKSDSDSGVNWWLIGGGVGVFVVLAVGILALLKKRSA